MFWSQIFRRVHHFAARPGDNGIVLPSSPDISCQRHYTNRARDSIWIGRLCPTVLPWGLRRVSFQVFLASVKTEDLLLPWLTDCCMRPASTEHYSDWIRAWFIYFFQLGNDSGSAEKTTLNCEENCEGSSIRSSLVCLNFFDIFEWLIDVVLISSEERIHSYYQSLSGLPKGNAIVKSVYRKPSA